MAPDVLVGDKDTRFTRIEPPMDRSRPTRIKVGPTTWRINYDDEAMRDIQRVAGQQFMLGVTRPTNGDILIDALSLPESHVRDTLWHEVLHAVFHVFHVAAKIDGDDLDENLTARATSPILQVLRDNPRLVRYLTQPDQELDQDQEA